LLMEADTDAPALHTQLKLNAPQGMGLSEQLERLSRVPSAGSLNIIRMAERLHALVESRWGTPSLLESDAFGRVLAHQRREHDLIIIDGPAVAGWPDTQVLREVDGVAFVVVEGTRIEDALQIAKRHFAPDRVFSIVRVGHAGKHAQS